MINQLRINGKSLYSDFGLYIKNRNISSPAIRQIKETIPYKSGAYDFTYLNGEAAYDERLLTYIIDIAEDNPILMRELKSDIEVWLYAAVDTNIYDDTDPDYYYHGSINTLAWAEEDSQGELTITFAVYPFRYARTETVLNYSVATSQTINFDNNSSHKIIPVVTVDAPITITIGETILSVAAGTYENNENFILGVGTNEWLIEGDANIIIRYRVEVL